MAHIEKSGWSESLKGFIIVDCVVGERNTIYLAGRLIVDPEKASMMWDSEIPSMGCVIYLDISGPDNIYGWQIDGLEKPKLGVSLKPDLQGLLVSSDEPNYVFVLGEDGDDEEVVDQDNGVILTRVKTMFGHAYAVGLGREIYRRTDVRSWEKEEGFDSEFVPDVGFNDIDGFAENDIYAVGDGGDVWHFDGVAWQQKGFPSNVSLATVTCGEDGNVYITGEGGSIWVGRDSTWKPIYEGKSTILWNDVVWFNDQLWLASDYRLRIWDGNNLVPPKMPTERKC